MESSRMVRSSRSLDRDRQDDIVDLAQGAVALGRFAWAGPNRELFTTSEPLTEKFSGKQSS
eukprot:11004611-Alexandrium_andersonii.AAC.1